MVFFIILSRLLDYPTEELQQALTEIRQQTESDQGIENQERQGILNMVSFLEAGSVIDRQRHYVDVFDMNPDHSLHLTHHLLGDDNRERGPALIQLAQHFCQHGMEVCSSELPDFLPLLLEFAAQQSPQEAETFLSEAVPALEILAGNLEKNGHNEHALLVRLVEQRGRRALNVD